MSETTKTKQFKAQSAFMVCSVGREGSSLETVSYELLEYLELNANLYIS